MEEAATEEVAAVAMEAVAAVVMVTVVVVVADLDTMDKSEWATSS